MPVGAQVVGDEEREVGRDRGLHRCRSARAARRESSASIASRGEPRGDQVVAAQRGRVDDLDPVRGDLVARRASTPSPRAGRRSPGRGTGRRCPAAPRGRASRESLGRAVDQDGDGITSSRASTVGTWRDVVAVVEDRVEVDLDVLALEQRSAAGSACPRPAGRAAGRSGTRRRAACPLETSASSTRWENSAPEVISRLARMRSAWTVIPRTTPQRQRQHLVEQDRRVRQDDPLGGGVRDVALVPQRDVLERHLGVAAQDAREPADALADDRVALVRHRARALLALAERLLDLAHLGALQVADLGREALQARRRRARSRYSSSAWRSRGTTWVETVSRRSPSSRSTRAS